MKKVIVIVVLFFLWFNNTVASELVLPVHVHIVQVNEPDYKTITTIENVKKDFEYANEVWKQAGIVWDIVKIDKTNAKITKKFKSDVKWLQTKYDNLGTDTSKIKKKKILDMHKRRILFWTELTNHKKYHNYKAINVYYVPNMFSKSCGMTRMDKKAEIRKKNSMASIIAEKMSPHLVPLYPYDVCAETKNKIKTETGFSPRSHYLAHELGHMLGLNHKGTKGKDLMMWGSGTMISPGVSKKARNYYKKYLKKKLEY